MNIYRNNCSYDNYEVLVIFLNYVMIEGYFDSRARLFKAGLRVSVLSDLRSESLKGNFSLIIFSTISERGNYPKKALKHRN